MLGYLISAFSGPAGGFMYALLAILAFGLAVVIDRSVMLWRGRCDLKQLLATLDQAVPLKQVPVLGASPMEQVVAAGLRWSVPELAWEAMLGASLAAEQQLRRRVSYLATIASVATMVGLFGTVYGLILAFGAMGDVAAAERAARLSEGSSTAMATTAFGLLVAIPALGAHALLEAAVRERLSAIEQAASRVMLLLRAAAVR